MTLLGVGSHQLEGERDSKGKRPERRMEIREEGREWERRERKKVGGRAGEEREMGNRRGGGRAGKEEEEQRRGGSTREKGAGEEDGSRRGVGKEEGSEPVPVFPQSAITELTVAQDLRHSPNLCPCPQQRLTGENQVSAPPQPRLDIFLNQREAGSTMDP